MTADPATPSATGPLRWLIAIGEANLASREKLVAYAHVRYAKWDTGACFPSTRTLMEGSGLSRRAVQLARRTLRRKGVLVYLCEPTGGRGRRRYGYTNQVRLDIGTLEALRKGAPRAPGGRIACAPGAHQVHGGSAPGAHKQTIHNQPSQLTKRTHHPEGGEKARAPAGWMDGGAGGDGDVRSLLTRCGVAGRNAELIAAAPGITTGIVRQEWESIRSDRSIRRPAGVLVSRLSERFGLALARGSTLGPDVLAVAHRINRLRGDQR